MKKSFLRMTLMVMGIDLTMPKNKTKSNLAAVLTGKKKMIRSRFLYLFIWNVIEPQIVKSGQT